MIVNTIFNITRFDQLMHIHYVELHINMMK